MPTTSDRKIKLGESGEHLVMSRLLAFGLVAGQLPRGYKSDDIYVELGNQVRHIQVKTRFGPRSWPVGNVSADSSRHYAFVHIASERSEDKITPTIYLIPSATVKELVELHHKIYCDAHPNFNGIGLPAVADPWRMSLEMTGEGFGPGWIESYREPWVKFISATESSS